MENVFSVCDLNGDLLLSPWKEVGLGCLTGQS